MRNTFTNIFSYGKISYKKSILSDSQIYNRSLELLKVNFINCYLGENISLIKNDIRDWDQSRDLDYRNQSQEWVWFMRAW